VESLWIEVRAVRPNERPALLVEADLFEYPGIGERAEDLTREDPHLLPKEEAMTTRQRSSRPPFARTAAKENRPFEPLGPPSARTDPVPWVSIPTAFVI
jgi:hypothetical protein